MRRKLSTFSDTMALMIVLWLCSLPLIGFVILPLFGRPTAIATALALLPVLLFICWGICGWQLSKNNTLLKSIL
jgi:hypothetical protein